MFKGKYIKAKEILKNNQTALMIFTDGRNLNINKDGSGKSGIWVINKNISVDKVIVYCRNKVRNINEIFVGNFVGLSPSQEKDYENRQTVEFNKMEFVGLTSENWNGFTDTKQGAVSPIKYMR